MTLLSFEAVESGLTVTLHYILTLMDCCMHVFMCVILLVLILLGIDLVIQNICCLDPKLVFGSSSARFCLLKFENWVQCTRFWPYFQME